MLSRDEEKEVQELERMRDFTSDIDALSQMFTDWLTNVQFATELEDY